MKSAYEIAMERLQTADREQGLDKPKSLTEMQKKQIAELRQQAKASKAELQILRDGRLAEAASDPVKLKEEEDNYLTDVRRIESRMESKIAEIKNASAS